MVKLQLHSCLRIMSRLMVRRILNTVLIVEQRRLYRVLEGLNAYSGLSLFMLCSQFLQCMFLSVSAICTIAVASLI